MSVLLFFKKKHRGKGWVPSLCLFSTWRPPLPTSWFPEIPLLSPPCSSEIPPSPVSWDSPSSPHPGSPPRFMRFLQIFSTPVYWDYPWFPPTRFPEIPPSFLRFPLVYSILDSWDSPWFSPSWFPEIPPGFPWLSFLPPRG